MNENRKIAATSFFYHRTMSDIRRYTLFLANLILLGCFSLLIAKSEIALPSVISLSIFSSVFWITESIRYQR